MARQTRSERRARRAAQLESQQAAASAQRTRPRQQLRPAAEPATADGGRRQAPGHGFWNFVQESIAELKKVEWPDQKAVISGTAVVLIACIIVGAFLWLNDEVWKYVVQHVLLR